MSATHFEMSNGEVACGRGGRSPYLSTLPFQVDCARCQRSPAYLLAMDLAAANPASLRQAAAKEHAELVARLPAGTLVFIGEAREPATLVRYDKFSRMWRIRWDADGSSGYVEAQRIALVE